MCNEAYRLLAFYNSFILCYTVLYNFLPLYLPLSEFKGKATYEQIKAYVLEQTGLKVSSLYIAQTKKKCGLDVGENFNLPKSENARQPQCTPEKKEAIMQAFKHFGMI